MSKESIETILRFMINIANKLFIQRKLPYYFQAKEVKYSEEDVQVLHKLISQNVLKMHAKH